MSTEIKIKMTPSQASNAASQYFSATGDDLLARYDGVYLIVAEDDANFIESIDLNEFIKTRPMVKLDGFLFNGVMCSATRDDQNGLTAIFVGFSSKLIDKTSFLFENGNKLILDSSNYEDFARQWSKFRQQFFNGDL